MLRNYLTIAVRTLWKHRGHAVINIVGLALGLAVCLLIALYVRHEWSYDAFHAKSDRIFQVLTVSTQDDGPVQRLAVTALPLKDALQTTYPQIEHIVRLKERSGVVKVGRDVFKTDVLYADSALFDMFSFPLVHGNPSTALEAPNNVVLTTEKARTYFGATDVVGQQLTIRLDGASYSFTVTGVAAPAPSASSIPLGIVLPFAKLEQIDDSYQNPRWGTLSANLFVQLPSTNHADELVAQFPAFVQKYLPAGQAKHWTFELLPLTEMHLTPGISAQLTPPSRPLYAYILSGIAVFILLIACINFVTLASGSAASRAQEIGVRKTVGAGRGQIMRQFWGEALLLCSVALLLGMGLARLGLPIFNQLIGKELTAAHLLHPDMAFVIAGLLVVVGLAAGSYPALMLSRFRPVAILRGRTAQSSSPRLVQGLVVVQFVLSIGLIIGTVAMHQQLEYVRSKDLGVDQTHVVRISVPFQEGVSLWDRLRSTLADEPRVRQVAGSWNQLGGGDGVEFNPLPVVTGGKSIGIGDEGDLEAHIFGATPGVVEALGLTVTEGQSFSDLNTRRTENVALVNQTFVEKMGWDAPIGRQVSVLFGVENARIIGVVEDLHVQSLHHPVQPLVVTTDAPITMLYVRLTPGAVGAALDRVRAAWNEVAPSLPFSYTFLDDSFDRQYRTDERWARLVTYAAGFAIFIACLGLFGLATLAAQRRTQEIGIRKVLGASVASVVTLLTRDFLKWVLLAFVVAAPLAYWAVQQWRQNFAYRADLSVWTFVAAGGVSGLAAMVAVGYQSIRTALTDPVKAIRSE